LLSTNHFAQSCRCERVNAKEISLVYDFIETIQALVFFKPQPIAEQALQCVIFTDQDMPPLFLADDAITQVDGVKLYVDVTKLLAVFEQGGIVLNYR